MISPAQYLHATWTFDLDLNDLSDQPISLAGADVILTIAHLDGTPIIVKRSQFGGIQVTDPAAGLATCTIQPGEQETGFEAPGMYIFQIKVVMADNAVSLQFDDILPLLKMV